MAENQNEQDRYVDPHTRDNSRYTTCIGDPRYDRVPTENYEIPSPPETIEQNPMHGRSLPVEPQYAEYNAFDGPPWKSSSFFAKRCFCYIVIILVVLIICATSITLGYIFTTSTKPTAFVVKPLAIKSCPQSVRVEAPEYSNSAQVFWNEPSAEYFVNASFLHEEQSHRSGDRFPIGSTEVLYTFTDPDGKTGRCSFLITVTDVTPPVVSNCPTNKEYILTDTDKEHVSWTEPTARDNSGGMIHISQSHQQDDVFPAGDTNVTYFFTDPSGNQALCVFIITITGLSHPNITSCPLDITRSAPLGGLSSVPVWWVEPSATDPSGGMLSIERSHQPGDSFDIGETAVTYTFTGERGLQSVCEFKVIVIVIDGSPPTINICPQNIVRKITADSNSVEVWWAEPTAISASGRTVTMIESDPKYPPGSRFTTGTTFINYIFIDSIGLRSICSFLITVLDLFPPTVYQCPKDVVFYAESKLDSVPVKWPQPYAKDNSGNATLISYSHSPGSLFHIGNTSINYVFADTSGNIASCNFNVRGKLKSSSSSIRITIATPSILALVSVLVLYCC